MHICARKGPAVTLTAQARQAQAACLRAKGYEQDAEYVEQGLAEFDPDALEALPPRELPSYCT